MTIAGGLVAGVLALVLFGWFVGPQRLLRTVSELHILPFAGGFLAVVGALIAQYLSLISLLNIRPTIGSAFGFLRGVYGRLIIPIGNVTGPLLIVYSIRSTTGISPDRGLPAALVAQTASFLGSTLVAIGGVVLLARRGHPEVLPLAGIFSLILLGWIAVFAGVVTGFGVERTITTIAAILHRTLGRLSSFVATRTEPEPIQHWLDQFDDARRLIQNNPTRLVRAITWATIAWILFTLPVITTGIALDLTVPLGVAFIAIPVSDLMSALPVPGGIGGVEVALAGIIVALTTIDLATAAVLSFGVRLCTYWFALLLGGIATTALSTGIDYPNRV